MHHGDGNRVVDEVHADEDRQIADEIEAVLELGDHGLHLPRPAGRGVDHISLRKRARDGLPDGFQVFSLPEAHVDSIDTPIFTEGHLCGIDIHDRQISSHGLCRTLGVEDTPDAECLDPFDRLHLNLLVNGKALTIGHGFGNENRVGLCQEQERVGDIGAFPGNAVIPHLGVHENVHPQDHHGSFLAGDEHAVRFNHRHGVLDSGNILHLLQERLGEPRLGPGDLKFGFPGHAGKGILEGEQDTSVNHPDGHDGGNTQADSDHGHECLGLAEAEMFQADVSQQVPEIHAGLPPSAISSDRLPSLSLMMRVPKEAALESWVTMTMV